MMGRVREYIGCRATECSDFNGKGDDLYSMWLTDTEVIRCRDCGKSRENGWKCSRFVEWVYDEAQEMGELAMASVSPDGFCAWAERREP